MSTEPKLKAYRLDCDDIDSHGTEVKFSKRGRDLRGCGPNDCDCPYIERHVKRAPEFDQYAPGPVTVRQYLAHGWQYECRGCWQYAYESHNPIVADDGSVFHNLDCLLKAHAKEVEYTNGKRCHQSIYDFIASMERALATAAGATVAK